MSMRQKVKPAEGVSVWHPTKGRPLNEDGESVLWTGYWERRLRDKSVVLGDGDLADKIKKQADAKAAKAKKEAAPKTDKTESATKKGGK